MSTFVISTLGFVAIAAMWFIAGCASTGTDRAAMGAVSGYICPLTGQELPCPDCCPLNQEHAKQASAQQSAETSEGYECPLTGEILPCPKCCPLNKED